MSLRRNRNGRKSFWIVLLALLSAGCGNNDYSPDHAESDTPVAETSSLAYRDLSDTATTSISVTTSGERDADTNAVRIFALVKDQDGTPLLSLNKYNFSVQLNPQTAPRVIESASVTLSTETSSDRVVALVIDSSGSMGTVDPTTGLTRLQAAKAAARLYVDNMSDGDFAAVVTFNSDARTVQSLTDDKVLLNQAINSLIAEGATNFGAAISKAVEAVGSRPGKRAMILLTDGDDTVDTITGGPDAWLDNSQSTRHQGLLGAQQNDFRVYTVGLGTDISDIGKADLQTFADQTGGAFYLAPTTSALSTPFAQTIPNEIAALPPVETFVLSFPNPYAPKSGQTRTVSYRFSVTYEDANGRLRNEITGVYQIP